MVDWAAEWGGGGVYLKVVKCFLRGSVSHRNTPLETGFQNKSLSQKHTKKRNSQLKKWFIILTNKVRRAASAPDPAPIRPTPTQQHTPTPPLSLPVSKLRRVAALLRLALHPWNLRLDPAGQQEVNKIRADESEKGYD